VRADRVLIGRSGSTDSLFASSWIGSDTTTTNSSSISSSKSKGDEGDSSSESLLFLTAFARYSARTPNEMRQTFVRMVTSPFDVDPITP